MGPRPANLKLSDDDLPRPPRRTFHVDLPSPRTGDVPPALSPLDAFALQSRLLAKRFEQEDEEGRRISRLPHQDVAREFGGRPGYFRAVSEDNAAIAKATAMSDVPELNEESANSSRPTTSAGLSNNPNARPVSQYPILGHMDKTDHERKTLNGQLLPEMPGSRSLTPVSKPQPPLPGIPQDYFGLAVPRAASPEAMPNRIVNVEAPSPSVKVPSLSHSIDSFTSSQPRNTTTNGSQHSQRSQRSDRGLVPPLSPRFPRSPRSFQSIRSVRQDSGDDETSSLNGYAVPSSRKFSGSSMSRPHSPFSPMLASHPDRSPSIRSDHSFIGGSQPLHQRPQFANFSRPMSSSGFSNARVSMDSRPSIDLRPSNDLPLREPSISNLSIHSSHASSSLSRQNSDDDSRKQRQVDPALDTKETASYIYAKYTLPRGRALERESVDHRTSWVNHQFSSWDQESSSATQNQSETDPKTPVADRHHHTNPLPEAEITDPSIFEQPPPRVSSPAGSERSLRRGAHAMKSDLRSSNRSPSAKPYEPQPSHRSTASVHTESTDRTIRATPLHERSSSAEITAEEHLEIGIQAHDAGQLSKSTYHLRLAARAGLPTAMLLYALACRHGWGMRPNQEDGVMWLRKAIEGSQLELSDLEAAIPRPRGKLDPGAEIAERKKRKAQFALAIYELGISYMNGWGCAKDKALAVRCYEVAGTWGDCDALAEAGFCYAEGQGVKKDLKKAAQLYRKAAEGGMSMAGNSWIYKAKYMDDETPNRPKTPDKNSGRPSTSHGPKDKDKDKDTEKSAGRARSRSIWGRKKDKDKS